MMMAFVMKMMIMMTIAMMMMMTMKLTNVMTMMTITCSSSMRRRGVFLPRRRMCAATLDVRCRKGQDEDNADVNDGDAVDGCNCLLHMRMCAATVDL